MNISSLGAGAVGFQSTTGIGATRSTQAGSVHQVPQDRSQLSETAKLMKQLEELRTSDPDKYKEVTGKIATRLEDAAKSAAENGNSNAAGALNDLAAKFQMASETGESVELRQQAPGSGTQNPNRLLRAFEQNQEQPFDPRQTLEGILSQELGV
ncbi:MAG: hypothetical protein JNK87_15760 [Bryobacterales bacterium]|nr:hypothetical protein [Bryobacterales bacterium]